jgi:FixJ family two-component response regulator
MTTFQRRVVLVDDDESVRTSLGRLFRSTGTELLAFESAEDFLAADAIDTVACLIVDVRMPKMRGLELQKICRARWPAMQVIMISAFNDDDEENRARRAGAIAFLHKPFDATSLVALVKKALASRGAESDARK